MEQEELPEPTVEQQEEFMDEMEDADLVTEEETDSRSALLKKVKSLIPKSNGPQKEKDEPAEPETEPSIQELPDEPQTEPVDKEEPTDEPKAEQATTTETEFSGCKNTFGYLAKRSPNTPIPQECMLCPKIVDCMLKIKAD